MDQEKHQKKIEEMFEKGILLSQDSLNQELDDTLIEKISAEEDLIVLNSDYREVIEQQSSLVDWYELDRYRVESEKDRDEDLYQTQLQGFRQVTLNLRSDSFNQDQEVVSLESDLELAEEGVKLSSGFSVDQEESSNVDETKIEITSLLTDNPENLTNTSPSSVTILISHKNYPQKHLITGFTNCFITRYKFLESLLRNRQELNNTTTINRVLGKKEKEQISIIGIVEDISETKNKNLILTIEDPTGRMKVLITQSKKEIYAMAQDLVVDEVVGINGTCGDKIIFAENIVWPDIPRDSELKKGDADEYAIFLSDIHVGSKLFLKEEFEKFLKWLRGETGNDNQRSIANKVKYIFIAGDLVDGVGIYPSQEEELAIKDIREQYVEFTRLISQIPLDKKIIMCPGNHDAVHLAEPQSAFYPEFSPGLFDLPNVELVTNPSLINIGKTNTFGGFNVLMYHGYSFDYYVAHVSSIRTSGGYKRSDLIMKFLLKRRHLAPSFTSTPYFPSHEEDPLLIKKVPDFFITGHIHYCSVANYKGVTMISGSCWQDKTGFQEKLGHEPEPGRVPLVNLRTREVKVLRFR
ncbi:MAG: DNA-directed DNA polymerase II small subunit [archaeon]|nr:DNA-directed DNA polymerase II small subunit [archaeon]